MNTTKRESVSKVKRRTGNSHLISFVVRVVLVSTITIAGCRNHHASDAVRAGNSTTAVKDKNNNLKAAILGLQASAVSDRLKAIKALRDLDSKKALRPLITTAANDEDSDVREAAAEAVLWLAEDHENEISIAIAKSLMRRIPELLLEDVEFVEAVSYLARKGNNCLYVRYQGSDVYRTTKITVRATNLTLAEAWCRLLDASGSSLIIRLENRIMLVPENN